MNDSDAAFRFNVEGVDRDGLLAEAAQRIDRLITADYGGEGGPSETPEGAELRAFQDDVAEWAAFPVVYRITDRDFLGQDLKVPVRFQQLSRAYDFYWLHFPITLFP